MADHKIEQDGEPAVQPANAAQQKAVHEFWERVGGRDKVKKQQDKDGGPTPASVPMPAAPASPESKPPEVKPQVPENQPK